MMQENPKPEQGAVTAFSFERMPVRVRIDENGEPWVVHGGHELSLIDVSQNMAMLNLLINGLGELTIKEVIAARDADFQAGRAPSSRLFDLATDLAVLSKNHRSKERFAYGVVARHLGGVVAGGANQPDVLSEDGTPVEIKTGSFGKSACKQLLRYMRASGKERGIACGSDLGCDLPDSISFIKIGFSVKSGYFIDHAANGTLDVNELDERVLDVIDAAAA